LLNVPPMESAIKRKSGFDGERADFCRHTQFRRDRPVSPL
jgi:hypothetical protein